MRAAQQVVSDVFKQLLVGLAVIAISLVFVLDPGLTGAQSVPPSDTPATDASSPTLNSTTQQPAIVAQDSLNRDIAETKRSYTGQLEEYRQLNQQFIVARQQFVQLGTLTSLEASVQATQKLTIMRDQVLLTYVRLLELELQASSGVEVGLKDQAVRLLSETNKAITRHLENTKTSLDRQSIAERSDEFESIEPLYSFTVGYTKQLLLLGKLRTSYDQAVGILNDIPESIPNQTELSRGERTRALDQIALTLEDVNALLRESELEMEESLNKVNLPQGDTLDDAYVTLTQATNFLQEVIRTPAR